MKTMTCRQLGGVCDTEFRAETWEAMVEKSRAHGMEMARRGDEEHIAAMEKMKEGMSDPEAMKEWIAEKRRMFDELPD